VLRTVEDMYGLPKLGESKSAHAITDVWIRGAFASPATVVADADAPFAMDLALAADPSATFTIAPPLPPGLGLVGSRIAGTPTDPGTYVLDVAAASATGARSQSLVVVVTKDVDSDGFADDVETALGSNPANAASTPTGAAAGLPVPCTVGKFAANLRFDHAGRDALAIQGTVSLDPGFVPSGATVVVAAGGVARAFTLDAKGHATADPKSRFSLATDGRFTLQLKQSDLAAALAGQGLTNSAAKRAPKGALVTVVVGGAAFQTVVRLAWTAKAGKSGAAAIAK
jgi:hypothetical protein